jgi:phosphoribosylformylglycinamidine cyclo-ligase
VAEVEMRRTFNCGVGFVLAVAGRDADRALAELRRLGQSPWIAGEVVRGSQEVQYK